MNNLELTNDKQKILKCVVDLYIETGQPVGSSTLVTRFNLSFSSAKVRYLMNNLEKMGYLEKTHTSSGRIPSIEGYKFYAKHLITQDSKSLREKIKDIFAKRRTSVDETVKEACKVISDTVGITLVTSETNESSTLKSIQLVPLTENQATIVLVTSFGEVTHRTITLDLNSTDMNDLRIAIRIFKERLIDVPILKLRETADSLAPILAGQIKNYESILESLVNNVFDFELQNKNVVYGKDKIILADEISRQDLTKILYLIENQSIWKTLEREIDDDAKLKIAVRDDHCSIITKKLETDGKIKEISLVGSNRMDYHRSLTAIKLLEDLIIDSDKNKE
ncbi:heat-inducible transcriptional repressor HrcA [Mycoplasma zalophidermidis]|uniref:Heat-inducible transcription repressor HrcA n=1 Tax=Mycoplasma zalophidermidis TaxID=398174 RepID=A0ABS6DS03_9MOLU|nr:heat-inducible transcriptional repressor HrcA [Mycoplasma zalophidermidis]MBU4689917.1 heat-inducible transcriptional repressor HrcA [Mycoplasma zalophidermidis]MBU4693792.1 heat-inducible transcriptional repressor HrcA [Mycoplasma zalophidermidis]MCR8966798.1 heat-inducible transcriptional repressor HrcA [Mycoplasma zalophidermidis]